MVLIECIIECTDEASIGEAQATAGAIQQALGMVGMNVPFINDVTVEVIDTDGTRYPGA